MDRKPRPLITRLQGGTGNQLFQYAIGYSLAKKHGRPLLVDKRTIEPEYPVRQYSLSEFLVEPDFVMGLTAFTTRWAASQTFGAVFRATFPPAWHYSIYRDREEGFDDRLVDLPSGTIVLHGYWQSYKYFQENETEIRALYRFRKELSGQNSQLADDIRRHHSVSVHIRRGDYVSNPAFAENLGACDPDYYQRAVNRTMSEIRNPRFYVFSDDSVWAKQAITWPAETTHVDHNLGRSDIDDLHLMSLCRHNIIANSSFSWWAAWLGDPTNRLVIAPRVWFKKDASPIDDRLPTQWVRL